VVTGLGLVAVACGGPSVKEIKPARPADLPEFIPAAEYQPEFQPEYRLRVGDEIRIEFLSDPEPATNASRVVVRPVGRISLRGVDDVLAAGLTPAQLDSTLSVRFGKLLVDPALSVIVDGFSGEQVFVLGEVRNPREIPLNGPMSLLQAIATSGGFVEGANRRQIVVVRQEGGGRLTVFMVNAERIMDDPSTAQELSLRAQDVVIVPKSAVAKVGEFVSLYFRNVNPALITVLTLQEIIQRERVGGIVVGN
jgi:polysaccharide export outer membrane protein